VTSISLDAAGAGQPSPIRLARGAYDAISSEAARSYPLEACGALLGREADAISEALPLANRETGQASRRFVIAPADYLAAEESADARALQLLGFWHSHPDHPARPSGTDREYAWPGLLTVVVAVEQGQPREITAWDVPGADQPFRRRQLVFEAE
jgi:proteasome lid subunit RPN8/RPN11